MLHTPPRAWGTRFDTLPTSPSSPSSPSLRGLPSPSRSLPVPSHHPNQSPSSTSTIDRHPHDASVFVGSLPTTVDLDHLTRLLGDHLSDYAQVKNIKVVRDSKGGVCAFVQCEDAVAAAKLIDTLNHTDQKTFFGRILRYEPARAFRSLLLSFRTPFESRSSTDTARDDPRQAEGISFELDLPFAMRLCKKPNSRFYNISYNDDAIEAERRAKSEQEDSNKLFLHPVVFDKKSLYEIATFFGRLEKFCPLDIPSCPEENTTERTGDRLWSRYPPLHNALRSPNMDKSCWEVKWEHRDDCLSALNTLRRVPHITATWAHQPTHFNLTHRSPSVYHASSLHYMHNYPNRPHTFLGKTPLKCGYYSSREGGIRNELESESCQASRDKLGGPTPLTRVDWSESDFPPLGTIYHHKSQNALLSKELQDNDQTFTSPFQARGKSPSVPSSSDLSHSPRRVSSISINREPSVTDSSGLENSLSPVPSGLKAHTGIYKDVDRSLYRRYNHAADPEVDPTTLFVGGLEMYGPGAWDENRLRHIFSKYKGLVNVQLVKPVNSPVAFAFVKFDNDEEPARAVAEEHNTIYDGRPMRVQLRDCNLRSSWKYGRGRSQARFHCDSDTSQKPRISDVETVEVSSTSEEEIPVGASHKDSSDTNSMTPHVSGNECSVISVSESSSSEEKNEVQTSKHADLTEGSPCTPQERQENREGVAMPSASPTISAESPTQGAGQATPPPYTYGATGGVNYYPTPWIQPYPHHVPYYGAYPAYASQAQYSDIPSGSPGIPPWVQGGAYTAYIPYSAHIARTQSVDQSQSHQHGHGEPPVVPTGFIQNEQGTLIAVYQTDALDRYLSANRNGVPSTQQAGITQAPVWNHHPQTPSASLSPSTSSQGPPIPVGGRHVVSGNSAPWAHIPSHLYYPAPSFPYFPPAPPHSHSYPSIYPAPLRGKTPRGDRPDGGSRHGGTRASGGRQFRAHTRPNVRGSFGVPRSYRPPGSPNYWDGAM